MSKNQRKSGRKRFYRRGGFWLTLLVLSLVAGGAALWYVEDFTRPYRERAAKYDLERINDLEIPSIIYDRDGEEIGRIFVQNRSVIPIDEVPPLFIDTLRAGEDSRFFQHRGIDYIGTLRALKFTWQGSAQGGSTITQQLARNAYDLKGEALRLKESTIQRKLVEAFLARRIEQRYTKRQILEFYLNRIYFGSGFYGIRSASLGYFGKEPMDLELAECASLVTLIKNPTGRSPLNNPGANQSGRNYVLGRMHEEGMIDAARLAEVRAQPLSLDPKPLRRGTSHLYERVADAVTRAMGEDALAAGGFKIHTTILAGAQQAAQQALEESLLRAESHPGHRRRTLAEYRAKPDGEPDFLQGAVLMVDHRTGEVLAHVGGRDYAQVPYDFIELGTRPPGTAFFPFLYAAALGSGQTPAAILADEPMDNRAVMVGGREGILGEWGMEVESPVHEGNIPVRRAFEASKIAASVRLANAVGLQRVRDAAVSFGLPWQEAELLPRLAVGFDEISLKQAVRGIAAFARAGRPGPRELVYLDRVEDPLGRVVFRESRSARVAAGSADGAAVIDEATAWQVHSMMAGSMLRGSSAGALDPLVERPFHGAGKGGSTHDFADAWFLGYNARVSCGVWTGYLSGQGEPIYPGAFSRDLALPVWQAAMNAAAPSFGGASLTPPTSVVEVKVCRISGQRATQFCHENVEDVNTGRFVTKDTAVSEFFRRGTENLAFCSEHSGTSLEEISPELALLDLPAMDSSPIRPKSPVLLGEDPYHAELPKFSAPGESSGFQYRRSNVLDSLDLGEFEVSIPLRRPSRLVIEED